MKRILLIIILIMAIFQMVVLATDIDAGAAAINRYDAASGNVTYLDLSNPANLTGKITNVAIYVNTAMASAKVATFHRVVDVTHYTAISVSGELGALAAGLQNIAVSLDITIGDYIGIYFTDAQDYIKYDTSGYGGVAFKAGDQTACVNQIFSVASSAAISLYGTGATVAVGGNAIFFGINF